MSAGVLTGAGFGRGDRIALVLPNGPELVTAYLSAISAFACAPINPSYRPNELDFFLSNLHPKAAIVQSGSPHELISGISDRGIQVIELKPSLKEESGLFSLSIASDRREPDFSGPGDTALLLYTSGTSSKPKLVPLSQSNIIVSAREVINSFRLSPDDRYLSILPLFHVYGLGMILASIMAGSSIICTTGFDQLKFLSWLKKFRPTWYAGSPPMHQAVLSALAQFGKPSGIKLRFARSASQSLPPRVMADLEQRLGCPVVEGFGMTEAGHLTATNPLPPGKRKAGSVGLARGCEVSIIGESGNFLPQGALGEIAVRGPNVMQGYENNKEATKSAFINGWLRTGDLGYIDGEGYIYIRGRIKEIINHGGEKIAPRDVEEALLSIPEVEQAAAFSIPSEIFGEDVGAAVVIRKGQQSSEEHLRLASSERLAQFEVPTRILMLQELPRGATGKIDRKSLSLIATQKAALIDGEDDIEHRLARLWESVLNIRPIGLDDSFFDLGGHSIIAVHLFEAVKTEFGVSLPLATLIQAPTIRKLAQSIRNQAAHGTKLVLLQARGHGDPIFFFHAVDGDLLNYDDLVASYGEDRPIYGLQLQEVDDQETLLSSIEHMAAEYIRMIKSVQPHGPYFLLGFSAGAITVFETARQLSDAGDKVGLLAILDCPAPLLSPSASRRRGFLLEFLSLYESVVFAARRRMVKRVFLDLPSRIVKLARFAAQAVGLGAVSREVMLPGWAAYLPESKQRVIFQYMKALDAYRPKAYPGKILLFRPNPVPLLSPTDPLLGWGSFAAGGVKSITISSFIHGGMLHKPFVGDLAKVLKREIDEVTAIYDSKPQQG
jgi:acyl-CoA synthetase (AMP-forming)/AMP-acid ligase II/thioesterase domain-containing protein/acyl carrier protein